MNNWTKAILGLIVALMLTLLGFWWKHRGADA